MASPENTAIVFDLDGTLIDSRSDIAIACNRMLTRAGRKPLSEARIAGFVGDGARQLVARALGLPDDDPSLGQHLEVFLDEYTAHPATHTTLMPGALEALRALSAHPLALCTNKPRRTTDAVLAALDLTKHFRVITAGDDFAHKKPHPLPLKRVAQALGLEPRRLIMVGDGPQDIECGHAVGAYSIGLRGGFLPLERLLASKPDLLLSSLDELPGAIRDFRARD